MQALVHVALGDGDVVLEASGNLIPQGMDDAEHRIAVLDRVDNDANGNQVIDLLKGLVLQDHLLVDRIEMLGPTVHIIVDMVLVKLIGELGDDGADVRLALGALHADLLHQHLVALGIQIAQREVLQLRLDRVDAQAVRKRGIDIQRLPRNRLLAVRRLEAQRTHVVQAVRKLDEHDADVLAHGQDHLAQALRLCLLAVGKVQLVELGDTVHEGGDLIAELSADVLQLNILAVLHRVMQKSRRNGGRINHELGEDARNKTGMDEVRLAALARLPRVRLLRKVVRLFHHLPSVARIILFHPGQHLVQRHLLKNGKHTSSPLFLLPCVCSLRWCSGSA